MQFIIEHKGFIGSCQPGCSPTTDEPGFTKVVAEVMHRPAWLPFPGEYSGIFMEKEKN